MFRRTLLKNIVFMLIYTISMTAFSQGNAGGTTMQTIEMEAGTSITFKASSVNGSSFQWFKDGQPISGASQMTLQINSVGVYTVVSYNSLNCSSLVSDPFQVVLKQTIASKKADLSIIKKSEIKTVSINQPYEYLITVKNNGPDPASDVIVTDKLPEGIIFKNVTASMPGGIKYDIENKTLTWKIDEILNKEQSELRFLAEAVDAGIVENTATVSALEPDPVLSNNQSTDAKTITDLQIPNVFTPNGDGVNDKFEIRNLNIYAENEISIINRWGNSVYEKKDYDNVWDGSGLDEGTYFFVLKVKNALGKWKAFKGYITLLRTQTQ